MKNMETDDGRKNGKRKEMDVEGLKSTDVTTDNSSYPVFI